MPYIAPVEKREFLAPRHFVHYSGPPQCACATLRPLKWPDAFEGLIACTLPISSAEAERSFSLFRQIKTYTRSTMTEERLSSLAIIAMHYSERILVDEVCHTFVQQHPRRLFE